MRVCFFPSVFAGIANINSFFFLSSRFFLLLFDGEILVIWYKSVLLSFGERKMPIWRDDTYSCSCAKNDGDCTRGTCISRPSAVHFVIYSNFWTWGLNFMRNRFFCFLFTCEWHTASHSSFLSALLSSSNTHTFSRSSSTNPSNSFSLALQKRCLRQNNVRTESVCGIGETVSILFFCFHFCCRFFFSLHNTFARTAYFRKHNWTNNGTWMVLTSTFLRRFQPMDLYISFTMNKNIDFDINFWWSVVKHAHSDVQRSVDHHWNDEFFAFWLECHTKDCDWLRKDEMWLTTWKWHNTVGVYYCCHLVSVWKVGLWPSTDAIINHCSSARQYFDWFLMFR